MAAPLVVGACSLLTDLGGLTGSDGGSDVATLDAGGSDTQAEAGSDCPSFAVFCDDFENEDSTFPRWDALVTNGTATVTTSTLAFSGTRSLHVSVDSDAGGDAFLSLTTHLGAAFGAGDVFAVRAYLYVSVPQNASAWFNLYATEAPGNTALKQGSSDQSAPCMNGLATCYYTYINAGPDFTQPSGSSFDTVMNQWVCVEWVVDVSDGGLEEAFVTTAPYALSGSPVLTGAHDTIIPALTNGYDALDVGYHAGVNVQDLYIDNVVVAKNPPGKRIGCN